MHTKNKIQKIKKTQFKLSLHLFVVDRVDKALAVLRLGSRLTQPQSRQAKIFIKRADKRFIFRDFCAFHGATDQNYPPDQD